MEDTTLDPVFAAAPVGPGQPLTYRQGVIVTFNPLTLQNTVAVGNSGAIFTDLPLLGVAEADTYAPGSVVGLLCTPYEMFIVGRLVRPNTPEAIDAINKLSNTITANTVVTGETTTSTTFTDLATYGPVVKANVRSSGRLLVILSAAISVFNTGTAPFEGRMGVQVDGPTSYLPAQLNDLTIGYSDNATHIIGDQMNAAFVLLLEGLTPGAYTLTAKYHSGGGGNQSQFAQRAIIAIAI